MQIDLTKPQFKLVTTNAQFPAFVGGLGSGKTAALITRAIMLKLKYPTCNIAYYLPTFDLVRLIAFPRFEEQLEKLSISYRSIKSLTPMIELEECGQIIMRTMDTPSRIIGYEVADSLVDELDTLKTEAATDVWNKIIARNRQKKPDGSMNTIAVGTTPEGFRFVYERWKKDPDAVKKGYELIKAPTSSNARNLPDGYVQNLTDSYPSSLIAAYLEGEFTNLRSGAVYPEFDRVLNGSNETIVDNEPLHIGMDFNVTKMAAVVFVPRGNPHAVAEIRDVFDTPAIIKIIKERWSKHPIFVYPDATGKNREANNASVSDIGLLKSAGFGVLHNHGNPLVKDRVLSMNVMIHSGHGRRLKVNVDKCPGFAEALEQQAYDKNGEPDKTSGLDHCIDAAGYFIAYRFPILSRLISKQKVVGN
jgi:hypothetical protein